MCKIIGCLPISTNGVGLILVSSNNLEPTPPARIIHLLIFAI